MFGFGFALVPFYKKICEVTGVNNVLKADLVENTQVDATRSVTHRVRFEPERQAAVDFPSAADERAGASRRVGAVVRCMTNPQYVRTVPVTGQSSAELRTVPQLARRCVTSRNSNVSALRSRRCSPAKRARCRWFSSSSADCPTTSTRLRCRTRFSKSKARRRKPADGNGARAKNAGRNTPAGGQGGILVVSRHPPARRVREGRDDAQAGAGHSRGHHRRDRSGIESRHAGAFLRVS